MLPLHNPLDLVTDLCKLTEMRGGQAAGLASVSWPPSSPASPSSRLVRNVRTRQIVPKRSTAASTLASSWRTKALASGSSPSSLLSPSSTSSCLLMGHLRFATSSRNRETESHPHIWLPWKKEPAWFTVRDPSTNALSLVRSPSATVGHMLTHNGDFDAVRIYDSPIPQVAVGRWLGLVLGCPCTVDSDSAKIAGYFDVFSTRGRWAPSARRAWVLAIAKSEADTVPSQQTFQKWGSLFERALLASSVPGTCPETSPDLFKQGVALLESSVTASLTNNKTAYSLSAYTTSQISAFVVSAVSSFLTADCYSCMSAFLRSAAGSFGLAVTAATEEGTVTLAAMGQPMAFAVDPSVGMVLYGSEVSAVRIPVQENFAPLRYRYSIDDQDGEVVRIGRTNYNREYVDALFGSDRSARQPLVARLSPQFSSSLEFSFDKLSPDYFHLSSRGSPSLSLTMLLRSFSAQQCAAVVPPAGDLVADDIKDIPQTLRDITLDWGEAASTNRLAANDFVHLFSDARFRHGGNGGMNGGNGGITGNGGNGGIDLLITGIESSLWLGEQLAADFKIVFPNVNVVCVSANKLLGALEAVPRMVHFCGYNRITSHQLTQDRPVVLCISQSGQTFATLHATRQLLSILHGNVFLVTGQADTKMREAVIDTLGPEAGNRRIMYNHSNLRVAEPTTVAACAMHHTLTEFLLYVSQCCCVIQANGVVQANGRRGGERARAGEAGGEPEKAGGDGGTGDGGTGDDFAGTDGFAGNGNNHNLEMAVVRDDLVDFRDLVDCLHDDLPELVHEQSRTCQRLQAQGVHWAQHITETWRVMVLSGVYILATVISGYPLFSLILLALPHAASTHPAAVYSLRTLDALLFIALPKVFSYLLRVLEGRAVLARHGKRTLVICDVPWVHQHLENYVTKLFALSYSFVSLECHGTCAHDDMVHNFTHRVARGTLLALGRPDGRVLSLLKTEQTIMLAAKQAAFIENMGVGPEIFTVGHNNVKSSIAETHVCVPSSRRKFLSETLYDFTLHAKESAFEQENFGEACAKILGNLYSQSVKLGVAYPRRILTVGVHHAKEEEGEKKGGGGGGGGELGSAQNDGEVSLDSSYNSSNHSRLSAGGSSNSGGPNSLPSALRSNRMRSSLSMGSEDDYAEEVLAMTAAAREQKMNVTIEPPDARSRGSASAGAPRSGGQRLTGGFFVRKEAQAGRGGGGRGAGGGGGSSTVHDEPQDQDDPLRSDPFEGSKHASLNLSLDARYAFASRLPGSVRRKLDKTQVIEHLFESRVASFERYVSMLVMFHSMARKCSNPWLLPAWDISRSQSNLRVATTACPVSVEEGDDEEEGEEEEGGGGGGGADADQAFFEESKHKIEESKARVGGERGIDISRHFPESNVAAGGDDLGKSGGSERSLEKSGGGGGGGGLMRARMNESNPSSLNELEHVKSVVRITVVESAADLGALMEENQI